MSDDSAPSMRHSSATTPSPSRASTVVRAVSVSADFKNFVEIVEAASKMVGDESFNCSVSIAKAMAGYRFDGDDLIMTIDGKDTRFEHD